MQQKQKRRAQNLTLRRSIRSSWRRRRLRRSLPPHRTIPGILRNHRIILRIHRPCVVIHRVGSIVQTSDSSVQVSVCGVASFHAGLGVCGLFLPEIGDATLDSELFGGAVVVVHRGDGGLGGDVVGLGGGVVETWHFGGSGADRGIGGSWCRVGG